MSEKFDPKAPAGTPVKISSRARVALSNLMRTWSGWNTATVRFQQPVEGEPAILGMTEHLERRFTVDVDRLTRNPHRVINTVTTGSLKREAFITGTMLHEAAHARFTHWKPRTPEALAAFKHSDGSPVTKQEFALASLIEESRIEGLMAAREKEFGAAGLGWTMRALHAHVEQPPQVDPIDPGAQALQVLTQYIATWGRAYAFAHFTQTPVPNVYLDADQQVMGWFKNYFERTNPPAVAYARAVGISRSLGVALRWGGTTGTVLPAVARDILNLLFPDRDSDEMPQVSASCPTPCEADPQDEAGGDSSDEQADEQAGEDSSDGQGQDGDESDGESDGDESDGESDGDESDGESEGDSSGAASLIALLRDIETDEVAEQQQQQQQQAKGAGSEGDDALPQPVSGNDSDPDGFRPPTADERMVNKEAERFLRSALSPTEATKVSLSSSPSAMVDAAEFSAWKAAGGQRDPRFFRRTQRSIEAAPPVKIAVLVDVSMSMDSLQEPSALLSWALSAASIDLRNFAGRGRQVESTLIHWGSTVKVVQRNGEHLPGIKIHPCRELTKTMGRALDAVEDEIPTFFTGSEDGKPSNNLLVQFTDWELNNDSIGVGVPRLRQAFANGVRQLVVYPERDLNRWQYERDIRNAGGTHLSHLLPYRGNPHTVWSEASKILGLR